MIDTEIRPTLSEFIEKHGIGLRYASVHTNPNMDDPKWDANHYSVTLRYNRDDRPTMGLFFSQGKGIKGGPKAAAVLDCLASDAASIENAGSFEEWASELGYDEDSRKAERTYRICCDQARQLKEWLGAAAYQELLWQVER